MAGHQCVSTPPASQLPAFALRSPHHPRGSRTPQLPHTHTAALTQTDHAGAVDVGFTQSAEHTEADESVRYMKVRKHTLFFHQSSSHLPDQALGGYSRVARTDLLLRGLMATKENRAVFFLFSSSFSSSENISSFAVASFSSSSRELSSWCCSRTNNTPCAQTYTDRKTHQSKTVWGVRQLQWQSKQTYAVGVSSETGRVW